MGTIVGHQAHSVKPQLTSIIAREVKRPITRIWNVDESAESGPPVVFETIVKTRVSGIH